MQRHFCPVMDVTPKKEKNNSRCHDPDIPLEVGVLLLDLGAVSMGASVYKFIKLHQAVQFYICI